MTRHVISVVLLWLGLTAIGESLVFLDLFPTVGAAEAKDFDQIFRILLFMGIPVFSFAIAMLAYSMLAFKGTGQPDEAGPTYRGSGAIPKIWLAITGSLAALVMVYPGMTGLADLQFSRDGFGWGKTDAELVVQVTGQQFAWSYEFPQSGVSIPPVAGKELWLPENTRVKFEIHALDVLHSFWIPAFRMKIDAVPGRMTFFTVETEHLGYYKDDDSFRVQCAELCGLNHTTMFTAVRVVSREDFEKWTQDQPKTEKK
jgi:cytochrome c oxidase subunit 2